MFSFSLSLGLYFSYLGYNIDIKQASSYGKNMEDWVQWKFRPEVDLSLVPRLGFEKRNCICFVSMHWGFLERLYLLKVSCLHVMCQGFVSAHSSLIHPVGVMWVTKGSEKNQKKAKYWLANRGNGAAYCELYARKKKTGVLCMVVFLDTGCMTATR